MPSGLQNRLEIKKRQTRADSEFLVSSPPSTHSRFLHRVTAGCVSLRVPFFIFFVKVLNRSVDVNGSILNRRPVLYRG